MTLLETDLTVRAKTCEVNVEDFSAGSYATIFGAEVSYHLVLFTGTYAYIHCLRNKRELEICFLYITGYILA